MTDVIDIATDLRTQSPERIWGVSAGSLYSALSAKAVSESLEERLSPHVRAETLRTNDERDLNDVVEIHEWGLEEFGLTDGERLTLLGSVVAASDNPRPLIRAAIVARIQSVETVLRSCSEIEENIPRREFDSLLADDWDEVVLGPLLGSLGFATIHPDSVDFSLERIESALHAQQRTTREVVVSEAYSRILPNLTSLDDESCIGHLVEQITGNSPNRELSGAVVAAALADSTTTFVEEDEISDAILAQRQEYQTEFDTLRSLLTPATETAVSRVETDHPIEIDDVSDAGHQDEETRSLVLDIITTVSRHPDITEFAVGFLTDRGASIAPYSLYQELKSIPGVACEVSEGVIKFESVPQEVSGDDLREEYTTYLVEECSAVKRRIDTLSDVSVTSTPTPVAAEMVVAEEYESLSSGDVAPAYFAYTLPDPDALGEKKMDDYVGGSRGLGRERARLRRWHDKLSTGLRSYTAMTDRLFSHGLERDIEDKVLRIMTPFDDDTFNEYVAQIRRLLDHGFRLRLLTRHTKEPWEWRRLQRNLLSEIKEHRDRVTVRTYSRFKEHQRVTPDMDFRDLGEFGIHGKLQTVGAPEEGAALLGSANFMENSYDWNPECGVYTERTQFVDAAIEFFDIVWNISAADELAIDRLQEIPDHQLIPTYYS
jgi:hypothetical protein